MGGPIRVAMVDDHPLFREGVAAVLQGTVEFQIVGQGGGSEAALRLARDRSPDVIVMDLNIGGDSIATIRRIIHAHPAIKVVILTASENESYVSDAMKSGVAGYILKGVTGAELARNLREIHLGARYVDPTLAARILAQQVVTTRPSGPTEFPELTSREGQIVGQVARGLTNKEVARVLTLSEKTVKHYMTSIMQKLQVRNRTELVLIASSKASAEERRSGRG